MAIEREVLKDIQNYKPKFLGPLSGRELVCIGLTGLICIPTFFLLHKYFVTGFCFLIASILGAPILACGFFPIYNMPLEKFFSVIIKTFFLSPTERKYSMRQYKEENSAPKENNKRKQSKKKKNIDPDFEPYD